MPIAASVHAKRPQPTAARPRHPEGPSGPLLRHLQQAGEVTGSGRRGARRNYHEDESPAPSSSARLTLETHAAALTIGPFSQPRSTGE